MRAIDCQGFAGAFTLGTAEAGFNVIAKVEHAGGFGVESVVANTSLLGGLDVHLGARVEWPRYDDVDYLFGNPPCSGFSLMNTSQLTSKNPRNFRGVRSPINDCMWDLVTYAASLNEGRGATVVAMESVQQAYKAGRELMRTLRDEVERLTGVRYQLTHVLVSGASLGAAQWRKRYFMVLSRIPFAVQVPDPREPVTYGQALGDLQGMLNTWERQPYARDASNDWQRAIRGDAVEVDGHSAPGRDGTVHTRQVLGLLDADVKWSQGESIKDVLLRYYAEHGEGTDGFNMPRILEKDWSMGFHQPKRIRADRPGYVVTGAGGLDFVHWVEDRFLTVREVGRLQGFPDTWTFNEAKSERQAYAWIGKGVPVHSGRWLSKQVARSLRGQLGFDDYAGVEIGDRERFIDLTYAWRGEVRQP